MSTVRRVLDHDGSNRGGDVLGNRQSVPGVVVTVHKHDVGGTPSRDLCNTVSML